MNAHQDSFDESQLAQFFWQAEDSSLSDDINDVCKNGNKVIDQSSAYRTQHVAACQDQSAEAVLMKSAAPTRPQAVRISPALKPHIPEEMYNLFQLAEVSLATSGNEFRSVLERWHKQREELARVLKNPKIRLASVTSNKEECLQKSAADISQDTFSTTTTTTSMDKPLDLSRDQSEVRMLTPSPSPTPSETHLSENLGLKKNFHHNNSSSSSSSSSSSDSDSATSSADVESTKSELKSDSHNDGHECPECGKRYSTSSNLARHRQTHRSPADQKARRCPHCDKVYVSVPAFSMHVRTHSQGCKCPYCGKSFSRPWLLQGHIRTHTGEKPFCCQICEKAFADKSNLRAHIQTHSNLKPFTCQRCGKAFALKSYLYKHEESSCMKITKPKID